MISVVIPLFNKKDRIAHTIRSVLNQTFREFEVVVVDDGSTDGSVDVVQNIDDNRIRIVRQRNAGVSAARNRGIAEARFGLIALLDADDEWMLGYLETQYNLYRKYPDCSAFVCNYEFRNAAGRVAPTILRKLPFTGEDGVLDNYFEVASNSHPPITSISVMIRKSVIEGVGGFPVGICSGEDLLTWARLAVIGKIAFSKKVGAVYDLGEGYDYANMPPRRQDAGDPVGRQLLSLYREHRGEKCTHGMKQYISHWHKMRASVAIRFGERAETLCEVAKSLWYNPLNYKVMPFAVLAVLPDKLRVSIIKRYGNE